MDERRLCAIHSLNSVIRLCAIASKGDGPQLLSVHVHYMLHAVVYGMLVYLFCTSLFISVIMSVLMIHRPVGLEMEISNMAIIHTRIYM